MGEFDNIVPIFNALSNGHWILAIALIITVIVGVLRKYISYVRNNKKYLPYVILVTSILASTSTRVIQGIELGKGDIIPFLVQGLLEGTLVGLTSMGWWSVGVKKLE